MSIDVIKSQINKFLSSASPEVMAIKGSWGIGKTYSWNKFLLEAKNNNGIELKKYSYVSLFGINSLDAFKFAIFEHIVKRELIGTEANIETFQANTTSILDSAGRKSLQLIEALSRLLSRTSLTTAIESLAFLSLSDTIICIDDLERRGKNLDIKDVLGLVSLLKEQKKCKIALLLNDGEEGLEEYLKYREKVIDFELEFAPAAEESAKIAFDGTELDIYVNETLKESCIKLNIKNIRVLKKIERLVKFAVPYLSDYEQEITHQVVHSLTLFSWCYYCHKTDEAPSLDYITNLGYGLYGIGDKKEDNEEHKKWKTIINGYGYQLTDGLDLALSKAVQSGYFIVDEIKIEADKKNQEIIASKSEGSFSKAWDLYHDSFNDNQNEVVSVLYESFKTNTKFISILNLNGTVTLFRELGENDKAEEIIDIYIEARKNFIKLIDINKYSFGNIKDQSLIDKFNKIHQSSTICETAKQVLERIVGKNGWSSQDEIVLSNTSIEEYYELFKSEKGDRLSTFITTCLQFGQFTNASGQQKSIADNATKALKKIARENTINKLRVRKYGIEVDDK